MKKDETKKILGFSLVRIALCAILIGISCNFLGSSFAGVIDPEDLVLVTGDDTKNYGATFSLDGPYAREIVLSTDYEGIDISWKYSLDKGLNWSIGQGLRFKLTEEEIEKLDASNDIVVKVTDLINQEERDFIIDLTKANLPGNLYANDLENKIFGSVSRLEWSFDQINWTKFDSGNPDLSGEKRIFVRVPESGTILKSDVREFIFNSSTDDKSREYVPVNKLLIESASSEITSGEARNAIDGNGLTAWKTNATDEVKSIVVRLSSPIYFKALEVKQGLNNIVKDVRVSTSVDGENWTLIANKTFSNEVAYPEIIDTNESVLAQFVRFEIVSTYEVGETSIAMMNIFEDNTKRIKPTAKVSFDVVELTNGEVTARLVDLSPNAVITSEGGDTHIFTENGIFKFTYKNELGMVGETVAKVDWIDKVVPSVEVKYETTSNGGVKATLINESELIEIINNGGNRSYTFYKNGTFEFVYRDLAGNESRITAVVDSFKKKPSAGSSTSSKPTTNSKNDNSSSNSGTSSTTKEPTLPPKEDESKDEDKKDKDSTELKTGNTFEINNVTIEVLGEEIKEPMALKMDTKELNKTLQAKVGESSLLFELYFVDKSEKKISLDKNYKMILKLDSDKVFKGVYSVDSSSKLTKLEYTTRGANEIELNLSDLSNYIISYSDKETNERKATTIDYVIALVLAIFLAAAAIVVYKKTR